MFSAGNLLLYLANRGRLYPPGKSGRDLMRKGYSNSAVVDQMSKCYIPDMTYDQHKGQSGRIGVIGGCQEYTGAPYFAAISALKLGADLSHVFCTRDAATVIKSYSPELIVHPILDGSPSEVSPWLQRLHTVVVGPGMGRDQKIMDNVERIVTEIRQKKIPCVVDADGLHLMTVRPDIIRGYDKAILTPNVAEFSRLYKKMTGEEPMWDELGSSVRTLCEKMDNVTIVLKGEQDTGEEPIWDEPVSSVRTLCEKMDYVTIVLKGEQDVISNGKHVLVCCGEGSPRRCGGQGDLLSGSMGVFSYWAHKAFDNLDQIDNEAFSIFGPTLTAAYSACLLTRECNRRAFSKHRRSMTTSDMIGCIQESFEVLFEKEKTESF